MPIIKGSTPTIKTVLSTDEVEYSSISKVYLTFAQNGTALAFPADPFEKEDGVLDADNKTITFSYSLAQNQTLALIEDVDLECQVDVLTLNGDRKISKIFSFGVCKTLRNTELS